MSQQLPRENSRMGGNMHTGSRDDPCGCMMHIPLPVFTTHPGATKAEAVASPCMSPSRTAGLEMIIADFLVQGVIIMRHGWRCQAL
jgi:hypothetical protein